MKNIIVILLSCLVLSLSLKDLAIYALFKTNQDFLSENLCINRFNPDELCYASCVLTQSIEDSKEKEEKYPSSTLEKQQQIVYTFHDLAKKIDLNSTYSKIPIAKRTNVLAISFLDDIFHPPEC